MKNKIQIFWLSAFLVLLMSCSIKKQNETSNLLAQLNKINSEYRDLVKGRIKEISVDTTAKIINIDNNRIPLNNYTAYYDSVYNPEHKRFIHLVTFYCLNKDTCIINSSRKEKAYGVGFGFKTKSMCLEFINLVNKLNTSISSKKFIP